MKQSRGLGLRSGNKMTDKVKHKRAEKSSGAQSGVEILIMEVHLPKAPSNRKQVFTAPIRVLKRITAVF